MPELGNDSTIIVSEKGSLTLVYEKGFYSVWKTEGTFYHIYLKGKKIQRCFNLDIAIKMIELAQYDYKLHMKDKSVVIKSKHDVNNFDVIKAVEIESLSRNARIKNLELRYERLKKHFDEIISNYRKLKNSHKEKLEYEKKETDQAQQKNKFLNKLSRSVLTLRKNEEKNYKVEEHKANLYSLAEEIRKIYFPKKETECQTT